MRQFGDTLVWLGLILVVAAVVYFAPRVASYVSTRDGQARGHGRVALYAPTGAVEASAEDVW